MSSIDVIDIHTRVAIGAGARYARVPADAAGDPAALRRLAPRFEEVAIPTTLAAIARSRGTLDLSNPPALENDDAWFLMPIPEIPGEGRAVLVLDGLATLAEVFVDDALVLRSDNAFHRHEVDVTELLRRDSELAIRFASLDAHLWQKRARPRWKTRLVERQELRFVRAPLIGRTTGFCPAVPAVGPYRSIRLERRRIEVVAPRVVPTVDGSDGTVEVTLGIRAHDGIPVRSARLEIAGRPPASLDVVVDGSLQSIEGRVLLANVERWWPHTHGAPTRYAARIVLARDDGETVVELPPIGFRTLETEPGRGFGLRVNGVPIFLRGAVWTTEDVLGLNADEASLRAALLRVRDAGMNAVRIGGTMAYEVDAFHALADELGILVWQELAFANMDYPVDDQAFRASVEREIRELLGRIGTRPSTAVICGNSEVEQQAAMLGIDRGAWRNPLFGEIAPALCRELAPRVPYVPSSPSGGTMPFHVDEGVGHYYGVGAYLRPLADARTSAVSFAGECLAFANVPCQATIDAFLRDLESPVHHPRWKERVPRDRGASWDFEDVRDHYLELLFGVSARELRYTDRDRYLALSRVVTGETMARVFSEWRRHGSPCRGAFVFFLQDFWPGAGFGIVDSFGRPKAAMRIVARVLAPLALLAIDEGVNGLHAHVANDRDETFQATLRARLLRDGEVEVGRGERTVTVAPHSVTGFHVDALFPGFVDTTYAYRFGPAGHDVVEIVLARGDDVVAHAHHLPLGLARPLETDLGLDAHLVDGGDAIELSTRRLAVFCALTLEGADPEDDFFHVVPGTKRVVRLRRTSTSAPRGSVHPCNQRQPTRVVAG